MGKKKRSKGKAQKPPKVECCLSSTRCSRCPIRMLKEGTLPPPYAVKKRVLVTVDGKGKVKAVSKGQLKKTWAA